MKLKIIFILGIFFLFSCTGKPGTESGIRVVTTIFPPYDFVRSIAGGKVQPVMLLKPGAETHSWEPAPQDIIAIQNSDIFIYVGGENEGWTKRVLEGMDLGGKRIIALFDCVNAVEEEIVEGMEAEEEESAYDEHVWTSPKNAKLIVEKISAALCAADPDNALLYRANTAAYTGKLDELNREFEAITESARRRTLVFGDRFPFRYFADEYGLSYFAAFPGCSTETEASAATIAFLINKIRNEKIPVVFYIEFSNGRIADAVCEESGAVKRLFHSAHNISRDELASGTSYLEIMRNNAEVLKEALQ